MNVIEHVFERRIREKLLVNEMQFGFRPGRGTIDVIFTERQMQEKHGNKGKKLYYAFVDLEKAFDTVSREVTRWALRKVELEKWSVCTVMAIYEGARQGSVFSPVVCDCDGSYHKGVTCRIAMGVTVCR